MQKHAVFSLISQNQLLEMDLALKYRTIPFFVILFDILFLKLTGAVITLCDQVCQ